MLIEIVFLFHIVRPLFPNDLIFTDKDVEVVETVFDRLGVI